MELDFKHASLQEIIDYAPDLRREAYVDATLRMQADDNIVGVFGSAYSEAQSHRRGPHLRLRSCAGADCRSGRLYF